MKDQLFCPSNLPDPTASTAQHSTAITAFDTAYHRWATRPEYPVTSFSVIYLLYIFLSSQSTMATPASSGLKFLSNALATPEQLSNSSSSIDGVAPDLEASIRFAGALLTQAAGVYLRLSQDIIAQAIVTFTRFWIGSEGGSLRIYNVKVGLTLSLYSAGALARIDRALQNTRTKVGRKLTD